MKAPAAVSVTRRSYKELVDGTLRVQIDVDPQFKRAFLDMFPEIDMPMAVAPLLPSAVSDDPIPSAPHNASGWKNLGPLAQSAVIICKELAFQEFVEEKTGSPCGGEITAADYVRLRCSIGTRKDLDSTDSAGGAFRALMSEYRAWQEQERELAGH